jgi:hypothetical protein
MFWTTDLGKDELPTDFFVRYINFSTSSCNKKLISSMQQCGDLFTC